MGDLHGQRRLVEVAALALERRRFRHAAVLFDEIGRRDDDPQWPHRAGNALRSAGDERGAVERLLIAVSRYAERDEPERALAVCKMVLQIDPAHAIARQLRELLAPTPPPARALPEEPLPDDDEDDEPLSIRILP